MKIDPTDAAFPIPYGRDPSAPHVSGLTIRAHFAAMAMQGMLANPVVMQTVGSRGIDPGPELAKAAVDSADYLIAELNK